jgi:hypothetical protein
MMHWSAARTRAAAECEVAGSREPPRERRGRFEVGKQDRGGPSGRLRDALHAFEMPQIARPGDGPEHRHACGRLVGECGAGESPRIVVQAHSRDVGRPLVAAVPVAPLERLGRHAARRQPVDERAQLGMHARAELVMATRRVGEDQVADLRERERAVSTVFCPVTPGEARGNRLGSEVVLAERDIRELEQAAVAAAKIVGHVGPPPVPIDDLAPGAGIPHGDRHRVRTGSAGAGTSAGRRCSSPDTTFGIVGRHSGRCPTYALYRRSPRAHKPSLAASVARTSLDPHRAR